MFFFQLPWLPEWWASANNFARVERMYRKTSVRRDAFKDEDIAVYKEALRQPGALKSGINYYRANAFRSLFRRGGGGGGGEKADEPCRRMQVPTPFFFGQQDSDVVPEMAPASGRLSDS